MKLLLSILFICCGMLSHAGSYKLQGYARDTVNALSTRQASVMLLHLPDSVPCCTAETDENGTFSLTADSGAYILVITHSSFATYTSPVSVNKPLTDIGMVCLSARSYLLDEISITDRQAVTLKGDTAEYAADSFAVRAYAQTDELLKKIPGVEVDGNGTIKAQGEVVKKILVDGDDFFSDNPAAVAKMLRAKAVEKVQVFNKKSEQAQFTGIDDGEKIKTINLVLKEEAKKGYFGNITAGGGLPDHFDNRAVMNTFKGKRKMSAFGNLNNVNPASAANGSAAADNASSFATQGNPGITRLWNAGLHYDNEWLPADAFSLSGDYQYNNIQTAAQSQVKTQYILPDSLYTNITRSGSSSLSQFHSLNIISVCKIDATAYIKINFHEGITQSTLQTSGNAITTGSSGAFVNAQRQDQENTSQGANTVMNLFYGKRYQKKGRNLSANISLNTQRNSGNGLLQSVNTFAAAPADSLNQKKISATQNLLATIKVAYTEPLGERSFLELSYTLGMNNNASRQLSYDQPVYGTGEGTLLDSLYSSDYKLKIRSNTIGANLRVNLTHLNILAGASVATSKYQQEDHLGTANYDYSVLNFFPSLTLQFKNRNKTPLTLNYSGQTQQPSIEQLQPLRQNTDPLNIAIGNPDLKQQFVHMLNLNYNTYNFKNSSYIFINATLSLIQHAISQRQYTDDQGRRMYQYINVEGNGNGGASLGYGFRIAPWYINASVKGGVDFYRTGNVVNDRKNTNSGTGYNASFSFSYYKNTVFDLSSSSTLTYTRSNNSIAPDVKNDFLSYQQQIAANVNPWPRYSLSTSLNWLLRQKIDPTDRYNNVLIWNAAMSYSFLKDRSLVLKLSVNDMLNQNTGFSRVIVNGNIMETSFNTLARYALLSLTWNITHQ